MITFLVPTIGRPSLASTLKSIETWPGDEILIVGNGVQEGLLSFKHARPEITLVNCPPGGDWGHAERNYATQFARGRYLAHIDDDDVYVPGTRGLMDQVIFETPDRPVIFRMRYPNGITLWQDQRVRCGNVGTPMILIPNVPEKLGTFGSFVGGDCHYLETMCWRENEIVWRREVIALLGHNT